MATPVKGFRERKLVQWAVAYLAGAWFLLEAFGFVADRFAWPAALVRGATILLAVGFLLALVLAWFHGERGRQRVSGTELLAIASLAVLAVVLLRVFAPAGGAAAGAGPGFSGLASSASGEAATRFLVLLPDGETLMGMEPALALSRDGSELAYVAGRGDSTQLYVRSLGDFDARRLPGTEGARAPFFSPDGEWIGFFADRALKKVSLRGGAPQTVVEGAWTARWEMILSGSWPEDSVMLVSYPGEELGSSVWRVDVSSGRARPVATHPWEENQYRPQMLPDGDHVLLSSWDQYGATRIMVVSLTTGAPRTLVEPGTDGRYLPTGHLLYRLGNDLLVAPFDASTLQVTGGPLPVVEGVLGTEYETGEFAVSESGTLAYVPAGVDKIERSLVWVDSAGAVEPVAESRIDAHTPRISPSGDRVAFQRRPQADLWVLDLERGVQGPIASIPDTTPAFWHVWTPDGTGVVFNADLRGTGWLNLFEARVGSSVPPRQLTSAPAHQMPQAWTPDGETLVYTQWQDSTTKVDIWSVPVPRDWTDESPRAPRPVLNTAASEFHPAVSPDGHWLAYASDVSGRWEVYVTSYPDAGQTVQISTAGGSEPSFAPDGRTLYYRSLGERNIAREMMAVALRPADRSGGPGLEADRPRVLFDGPYFQCSEWGRSYDLAPDGSRFLMVLDRRPELTATQINVVVHWFAELPTI